MNNMLSYCGLVDAKIRASDKDLPVKENMSAIRNTMFLGVALGALTDLILIYGAKNRKIVLIHIWNYAQYFVGGAFCCMLIKPYVDLVQVTFEAIREIKKEILQESRNFHIWPITQPPTMKKFGIL